MSCIDYIVLKSDHAFNCWLLIIVALFCKERKTFYVSRTQQSHPLQTFSLCTTDSCSRIYKSYGPERNLKKSFCPIEKSSSESVKELMQFFAIQLRPRGMHASNKKRMFCVTVIPEYPPPPGHMVLSWEKTITVQPKGWNHLRHTRVAVEFPRGNFLLFLSLEGIKNSNRQIRRL